MSELDENEPSEHVKVDIATIEDLLPKKEYTPIEDVENDNLRKRDMITFISATLTQNGLVGHNIDGFNDFIKMGISRIMTNLFDFDRMISNEREQDNKISTFRIKFKFHGISVGSPMRTTYRTGNFTDLLPNSALLTGHPYSGAINLSATVTLKAHFTDGHSEEKTTEIPQFQMGSFPIMVKSDKCHTNNMTREALKRLGEDPTNPGGYFIAKRGEYVVDLLENIRYNSVHIHNNMKPNEHVRAEFISQPGGAFENSSLIRLRYMTNGQITIEITSTKYENVRLPFFVLYRMFGMTNDKDITSTIVFDIEDKGIITTHMFNILEKAFQSADAAFSPLISELNREKIVQMTAERIAGSLIKNPTSQLTSEHAIQFLNEDLLGNHTKPGGLDKILLPHMGQTSESRIRKLRFLGLIIHKMLLVHLKVLPQTDRDSLRNKRVHGAGVSLAKAFKTQVNNSVVQQIYKSFKRELKNNAWETITEKTMVDTFRNSLATSNLNRAMERAITSGNKKIVVQRRTATNRVSSQALERKNILNTISALRTVVTQNAGNASKQTERADMIRRVHPTFTGFICVVQSLDTGENVGMRKQLAITAGVCTAGEALPLELRILSDENVIELDKVVSADMLRKNLSRIYVNGKWIGCCTNSHVLVDRYRKLRREGRIVDPKTTIYWDPVLNEIEFWLDVGRLVRPIIIVDSNIEAYDKYRRDLHIWKNGDKKGEEPSPVKFTQNMRFTHEHARAIIEGRLTLDDLITEGIAEYITPEEQENCLIAESIDVLFENRHNVIMRFSHVDVEQAIFGMAAHMSPFGNHTQPARVTYETNQSRQTCGWYTCNFPFSADKNRFFQFYNEVPLIKTLTHRLVPANGMNTIIAYASYGGDNQEDSAIVNQASADRGLFNGVFFRYEEAELEKGESFRNPDILTTKNLKPNASYEKLVDGIIKVGSIVHYGDVLIGRIAKLSKERADGKYQYTDRSIVYRLHEPAMVESVMKLRDENDSPFVVVKLRYERPLRTGDKMSSRSGNKCLTSDHDVLTCRGWIPIADVTLEDEVACLDDGNLIYEKPYALHQYNLTDEELIEVDSADVSLKTTLNHRMYIKEHGQYEYKMCEAKELTSYGLHTYKHNANVKEISQVVIAGSFINASDNPDWENQFIDVWVLSKDCKQFIDEKFRSNNIFVAATKLDADNMQMVALHMGYYAQIQKIHDKYLVRIMNTNLPVHNSSYKLVKFTGSVHCITVRSGIFYVRRNGKPVWTGNSIVARMMQQSDMPFTEDGITPDLIINTHSFPSRMTIGQLIETSLGKVCAQRGAITDGTAFLPVDHYEIQKELVENGFRYNGRERMYNGMTGEYFDAAIFIGPTVKQRLQKFVLDDEQSVAGSGPTDATTGQPLGGKQVQGGLRIGEMEYWCFESHGSMLNLYEKSSTDSDGRSMYVCRNCGAFAIYNEYHNIYQCRTCGDMADISRIDGSKTAVLFHEELAAANIRMRMGLRPREYDE